MVPDERSGEVLRDASALTLGDEPLAGAVEHRASELWMSFPPKLVPRILLNSLKEELEWHERDTMKKTF